MYIFSLPSNVYQIKINMKNSVNKSVCLWHCAISGEIVELYFKKYLLNNFDKIGNSTDGQL